MTKPQVAAWRVIIWAAILLRLPLLLQCSYCRWLLLQLLLGLLLLLLYRVAPAPLQLLRNRALGTSVGAAAVFPFCTSPLQRLLVLSANGSCGSGSQFLTAAAVTLQDELIATVYEECCPCCIYCYHASCCLPLLLYRVVLHVSMQQQRLLLPSSTLVAATKVGICSNSRRCCMNTCNTTSSRSSSSSTRHQQW